jgi:hypothetical protein
VVTIWRGFGIYMPDKRLQQNLCDELGRLERSGTDTERAAMPMASVESGREADCV